MWWVAAVACWLVGASALALLVGAVLRRGQAEPVAAADAAPGADDRRASGPSTVHVPAQRAASTSPVTPPYGLRSQAHLSCAGARPRR